MDDNRIGCGLALGCVIMIGLMIWHEESKPVPPPPPPTLEQIKTADARAKWTIECEGEFADDRSYSGVHRIYRMKNVDGTELIAVTGVGLERGSHKSGKTMVEDER